MSADAESFVFDPHAPMHTGTGHQLINPAFFLGSPPRREHDPRVVAREHLDLLEQRFVEPDPYDKVRDLLANRRSVLLTGAPGSGRRATAQMLLHRLPDAEGQIRYLPDDPRDPSDELVLDASAVDSGQRLLLDLSARDETYCAVVLEQLPAYREMVKERRAHLVVVLPHSRKHYLGSELGSIMEIVRPNGREVFRRYLRCDGVTRSAQLDVAELTTLLHSGPMEQIAKLAGLVLDAKESEPAKEFPRWRDEALAALTQRSGEVARKVQELQQSGQQSSQRCALLLATAIFGEAHADAIFVSTSRLCEIVGYTEDDRPRLQQEGFAEQLVEIGAETDAAGRVRFIPLAYDRAVRTHFWTNYPDLRETFRDWVGTALGHRTLSSEDRDAVVARFAEQALRTDRPEDLQHLAEHWVRRVDGGRPSPLLLQALRAVEHGLIHERHGLFFRRKLLDWSRRDPRLSSDLAQVVVQVCAEVLALTHPEQAVVRLHHIFRRHSNAAGAAAHDVLLDLVNRDRRPYRCLLDRVTRSMEANYYEAADRALFLELVDSAHLTAVQRPLIADETVREQLVNGWTAVLSGPFWRRSADRVGTWLACEDDRHRERLLDVLVSSGVDRNDLLSRLRVIARDWAYAPDDRRAERIGIFARLQNKIDFAQGIDFTGLDLGDRTEETAP